MNKVAWFNALPEEQAQAELLKCCGSKSWARHMTERRPFTDLQAVLSASDQIWTTLDADAWLEAFRSHPRIGEKKAESKQSETARAWSEQEQAGTQESSENVMAELAAGNDSYANKFGFIFIVCATGKSAEQMLSILKSRLPNEPEIELKTAAEEQRKITQVRLTKLLQE